MNKSLFNHPDDCVDEFLSGFLASHRGLIRLPDERVILRRDLYNLKGKVAVLSGGGAGHEPAFAGYVGKGMLSGAISGAVFSSPPPSSIYAAIKAVSKYTTAGVLLIILNYTGDRINFGLAKERSASKGIQVEMVVVDEDCALTSNDRSAGRRGLAGAILVHKIGGALAEEGKSLQEIQKTLQRVVQNMGTIGICLRPCVLPGAEKSSFELSEDEMELGLGVHGEAGIRRTKIQKCSTTIKMMLDHMMDQNSASHLILSDQDEIVLLVNNLGGTSFLEIGVATNEAAIALTARGVKVQKIFMGPFITSLQMMGISITILKLNKIYHDNLDLLPLLEMKTDVANPLTTVGSENSHWMPDLDELKQENILPVFEMQPKLLESMGLALKDCIISSCEKLLELKETLNDFDRGSGDGDCGSTHATGAVEVLTAIKKMKNEDFQSPDNIFQTISICCEKMGGTSGALYSIFMAATARKLSISETFSRNTFAEAVKEGVNAIEQYGGARLGDRTMLDVLKPVSSILVGSSDKNLTTLCEIISKLSREAAKETSDMKAKAGRASYVSHDQLKNPDPGAEAVSSIICTCADILKKIE